MKILVINAGSSSIKYQLINVEEQKLIAKGSVERIGIDGSKITHKANGNVTEICEGIETHEEAMKLVLKMLTDDKVGVISSLDEINGFGHRFVHGGPDYTKPILITDKVMQDLYDNRDLAPLHMLANIAGVNACRNVLPTCPNVAVFDTGFHSTIPDYAFMYPVPYEWFERYKVRRYGFHGVSHEYVSKTVANVLNKNYKDLKIITCHIGNGASVSAIKNGECVDTSMGFTPLEGLMMGSRSGDFDPSVIEYVVNKTGKSVSEINRILNKESGLLGISGISSDIRDILPHVNSNKRAKLTIEMFVYKIKKYIGAYAAIMGGVDVIVFTAGTGENRSEIREMVMENMDYLGVEFDTEANHNFIRGEICEISKPSSKVKVFVVPTDEEMVIAQETKKLI